jgi:hypothetical protein
MSNIYDRKRRRESDNNDLPLDSPRKRRLIPSHRSSILTRAALRRLNETGAEPLRGILTACNDADLQVTAALGGPDITDLRGVCASFSLFPAGFTKHSRSAVPFSHELQ